MVGSDFVNKVHLAVQGSVSVLGETRDCSPRFLVFLKCELAAVTMKVKKNPNFFKALQKRTDAFPRWCLPALHGAHVPPLPLSHLLKSSEHDKMPLGPPTTNKLDEREQCSTALKKQNKNAAWITNSLFGVAHKPRKNTTAANKEVRRCFVVCS